MFITKKQMVIFFIILIILILSVVFYNITFKEISSNAQSKEGISVPVIMYHSITNNHNKIGKYVIKEDDLEEDIKYILDKGYTPITITELINYVYEGESLPNKPMILTFDDGYYNNYAYMFPFAKKYSIKFVLSVIGTYTQQYTENKDFNLNYAHVSWEHIEEMSLSGYVEIQNHSYDMHTNTARKGSSIMKGENYEAYQKLLVNDNLKLQKTLEKNCSILPNTYTYPFGYICDENEALVKEMGFKASLSCYEGINIITKDKECLFNLKRYNRGGTYTTKEFMEKILE